MTNIAVVSTSINTKPAAYAEWAKAGDLIVAGDTNTPLDLIAYVNELSGVYLSPKSQEAHPWSRYIGWRCVQRRNAAIFEALVAGYDYVLTVDDDNFPLPSGLEYVEQHLTHMGLQEVETFISSESGYVNPGAFCIPPFHARGVPYGVNTEPVIQREKPRHVNIVVSQSQVLGDPDCDAVERICFGPVIQAVSYNALIKPGTYAAFNSQATMWTREWAPVMAVLPGIGRYDDIFASFIFHRLAREYDVALYVGMPVVRQYRNEHDVRRDLQAENWGMKNVFEFIRALDTADITGSMPLWMAYDELIVAASHILPSNTVGFAKTWVRSWRDVV